MNTIPLSPLSPDDAENLSEYIRIHAMWVQQGRASSIESLSEGWIRVALFPDGGSQPTFSLLASHPGTTSENLDSGITGLG